MIHKKDDLRIKRTHKLIRNALIELIAEKGFAAITIGDIASRAMINRSTFYRHYEDKYDLVTRIFKDAIDQMVVEIGPPLENPIAIDLVDPPKGWERFFEHLAGHAQMYQAMLGPNGSPWFAFEMRNYLANIVRQRIQALGEKGNPGSIPEEVITAFIANCCLGVMVWWLESGKAVSPTQIADWFSKFILYGYFNILQIKP
ncbi:MAG: TetR/AcrR family transcriptional regulator [Anaerolineae bacterium]|nr:TetR/AcrR family transcriptional regulator [Anaerolineae bacterium]